MKEIEESQDFPKIAPKRHRFPRPMSHFFVIIFCALCFGLPILLLAETEDSLDTWKKFSDLPIVAIEYKSEGEFPESKVRSATVIKVGDPFSRSQISKSIENIYSLGGFSNIVVSAELKDNGVALTFILTSQMKIANVSIVGNKNIEKDKIIEVMRLRPGRGYDDSVALKDAESIKALYKSLGYFSAEVSFTSSIDNRSGQANLTFNISEGERPIIGEIIFTGTNEAVIRTKDLLKAMKETNLGGTYKGYLALSSDVKRIEEMYRQREYLTAKVKRAVVLSDPSEIEEYRGKGRHFSAEQAKSGSSVAVVIEIEQGKRVYIKFKGNKNIKDDRIKEVLAIQRMQSVSEPVIRRSGSDIKNLYKQNGYYLAEVNYSILKDIVWDFDNSTEGWEPLKNSMHFDLSDGILKISPQDVNPPDPLQEKKDRKVWGIQSPPLDVDSYIYRKVLIRMKLRSETATSSPVSGRLYWVTDRSKKWNQKRSRDFEVIVDNQFHDYEISMPSFGSWSDTVTRLRFIPPALPDSEADIEWIKVTTEFIPIVFEIKENKQMRIGKISIVANEGQKLDMDKKSITKQMLTRKKSLLSFWKLKKYFPTGIFNEVTFQEDLRAITAFYRDNGYMNPVIVPQILTKPKEGRIDIELKISEGPRTLVNEVVLEGNRVLSSEEILSNLSVISNFNKQNLIIEDSRTRYKVVPPKPFRSEDVVSDRSYIRFIYADKGYTSRVVEPIQQFSDDFSEVRITYRITEGVQTKIDDEIEIRGNVKTKRRIIERELSDKLKKDRVFSYTEIAKSSQRIRDLGLFESVRVDTQSVGGSDDLVKMIIDVKERKARSINMNIGFGSLEGFRGGIEAVDINLGGTARRVSGKAQIGTQGQRLQIDYMEPRLFGTDASGFINLYPHVEYRQEDYMETRKGGTTGLSWRFARVNTLSLGYRYDVLEYTANSDEDEKVTKIGRMETTFQRDGRDNMLNPQKGSFYGLTLEYANPRLGGFEVFTKLSMNYTRYSRLFGNVVLALGARAGYAWGLGDTGRVLTPELFNMRDYQTPRGYKWEDKGTGSIMLSSSLELRIPVYKWIGIAAFFDSGQMYDGLSELSIPAMKSAVGLGLRLITPIGPARLDYGYPLRGDGDRRYWPDIAFGHAF